MSLPTNATGVGAMCEYRLGDDMERFDRLPAAVRRALNYGAVKWSALDVASQCEDLLDQRQPNTICRYLQQAEAWEREQFNAYHLATHGYELPHVAAGCRPLKGP